MSQRPMVKAPFIVNLLISLLLIFLIFIFVLINNRKANKIFDIAILVRDHLKSVIPLKIRVKAIIGMVATISNKKKFEV